MLFNSSSLLCKMFCGCRQRCHSTLMQTMQSPISSRRHMSSNSLPQKLIGSTYVISFPLTLKFICNVTSVENRKKLTDFNIVREENLMYKQNIFFLVGVNYNFNLSDRVGSDNRLILSAFYHFSLLLLLFSYCQLSQLWFFSFFFIMPGFNILM